jgi:hypothetical protein
VEDGGYRPVDELEHRDAPFSVDPVERAGPFVTGESDGSVQMIVIVIYLS